MHYLRNEAWHRARMQALARKQQGFIINPYAFGGGAPPGPSGLISLLHFNGSHGSSTFTDETGKIWTAQTGAQISNVESVFGGLSGSFDGASGYISTPDHADWEFGSGDFTLQGRSWFFSVAGGSNYPIICKNAVSGFGSFLIYKIGGTLYLFLATADGAWDIASAVSFGTVTAGTWYAWSVSRVGTSIYMHLDGTHVNTVTSSAALWNNAEEVKIGSNGFSYHQGYTDEFRALKGNGLYNGSNYTLDASEFPYP